MSNYDKILDHAIENGLNVLLIGKHGVGKTAIIKDCFENHGLKWRYFSASTMDPWVDFIGVPKEKIGEDGVPVLELVRPSEFAHDEIEAVFFDELNRSHKKIRNAIMELIQFRSINGKEFKNLRVIWAAINPDDDEEAAYDVERLDPAQMDRFHLQIDVPYKPITQYFTDQFGEMGEQACKWWNDQKPEIKDLISPRRLDYALRVMTTGGDVRYVLNSRKINVTEFVQSINRGNPVRDLEQLMTKNEAEVRKFFSNHNELKRVMSDLVDQDRFMKAFAHLLPEEEILSQVQPKRRRNKFAQYVEENPARFESIIDAVLSNQNAYKREVCVAFDRFRKAKQSQGAAIATKPVASSSVTMVQLAGKQWDTKTLTFCFTGKLTTYTREQAMRLVEGFGCKTSASATYGVTHLVCGDDVGAHKTTKAKQLGITTITEQEFQQAFVTNMIASNSTLVNPPSDVTVARRNNDGTKLLQINGKNFLSSELSHDTMVEKTGRRFRMSEDQRLRCSQGNLTREQAFKEWIELL